MDKQQLFAAINSSYARWQHALGQVPPERMTEPSLNGWSVKDIIAHVTWYEREMIDVFGKHALIGSPLWDKPLHERNAAIDAQNRDRDLADIQAEASDVHTRLLATLDGIAEEDLHGAARFADMPPDWDPADLLGSNTYQHYTEHEHEIGDWLANGTTGLNDLSSKAGILAALLKQRADWDNILAQLDDAAMEQPGAMGEWPFRDLVAHLTGWRKRTAALLEAAVNGASEPAPPEWPTEFDDDADKINPWIEETNRSRPLADVLDESRQVLGRIYTAVDALPEDDLLTPGRFAWMEGEPLGNTIEYSMAHHYRDHGFDIDDWLAKHGRA